MDIELLQRLLAEGESSHLDYKSEQYPFVRATDTDKSELLKDVLAMANAWRETDAYILIGVKENPGQRAEVVGITDHLDDADIQQFVNAKTKRAITFSYKPFEIHGKTIAVIRIPLQRRPFFVSKRYGLVEENKVYLRRGTATVVADPEEIHLMGVASSTPAKPSVRVEFADLKKREGLGQSVALKRHVLRPLPDGRLPPKPEVKYDSPYSLAGFGSSPNPDYWYELREYMCIRSIVTGVGFAITNTSSVVAEGVRVKLTTLHNDSVLVIDSYPIKPRWMHDMIPTVRDFPAVINHQVLDDVEYRRHGDTWHVVITFGKVKPGDTEWTTNRLLIGTVDSREVVLSGSVFADNFEPFPIEMRIVSDPTVSDMTVKQLKDAKTSMADDDESDDETDE